MWYPSETRYKLKSREVSFARDLFGAKHDSVTIVLCEKFQNDWITEADAMEKWELARFQFVMSFGWISYIAQHPRSLFIKNA